eukprot:CAMPEP_0185254406 /NCGR_PEP_ID=MMETSP1359-20130426/3184_1 /TAXON_ID=552665 /ORGANISM="Bigelowiella longifila, Strain CCMP242" /LENGTH=42 /DNA_ID= /DNA_START= /DNA_END= /DNA_ORIENTATION=
MASSVNLLKIVNLSEETKALAHNPLLFKPEPENDGNYFYNTF